jgi:5-formyltetrahydrofolate cyclo-ligase
MNKKELRKIYKEKRMAISSADKSKWDDLLLIRFGQFDFTGVHAVFSYWPMDQVKEPDTHLFTRYLQHKLPGIRLAYPLCDFSTCEMKAVLVDGHTHYNVNSFGIMEPERETVLDAAALDMILVPLLICDKQGNRVGFGKGFYDRFFKSCRDTTLKVGFSYFEPVDKIEDTEAFDVPLNFCITPFHIYEF